MPKSCFLNEKNTKEISKKSHTLSPTTKLVQSHRGNERIPTSESLFYRLERQQTCRLLQCEVTRVLKVGQELQELLILQVNPVERITLREVVVNAIQHIGIEVIKAIE